MMYKFSVYSFVYKPSHGFTIDFIVASEQADDYGSYTVQVPFDETDIDAGRYMEKIMVAMRLHVLNHSAHAEVRQALKNLSFVAHYDNLLLDTNKLNL
jgi:hypothetical protein